MYYAGKGEKRGRGFLGIVVRMILLMIAIKRKR